MEGSWPERIAVVGGRGGADGDRPLPIQSVKVKQDSFSSRCTEPVSHAAASTVSDGLELKPVVGSDRGSWPFDKEGQS